MTTTTDLQRQALLEIRVDNHWSTDRLVSEIGTDRETFMRWVAGDQPETWEQYLRRMYLLTSVSAFLDNYQAPVPVPRLRSDKVKRGLG